MSLFWVCMCASVLDRHVIYHKYSAQMRELTLSSVQWSLETFKVKVNYEQCEKWNKSSVEQEQSQMWKLYYMYLLPFIL